MRCFYSLSRFTLRLHSFHSIIRACVCVFACRSVQFSGASLFKFLILSHWFIYLPAIQRRKKKIMDVYLLWINRVKSSDLTHRHRQTRRTDKSANGFFVFVFFIFVLVLLQPQRLCVQTVCVSHLWIHCTQGSNCIADLFLAFFFRIAESQKSSQ